MNRRYCSFEPIVVPYTLKRPICWDEQFSRKAPIDVEIGFGMGEVLIRSARQSPDRNHIGIEQHWERIYKTLRAITIEQSLQQGPLCGNIRILKLDARLCFERLFGCRSIDSVVCLFPCPWPKKGHVKHRLFTNAFLRLVNNRLKNGGQLKIVTDYYPYYEWILDQSSKTGFHVETSTALSQYGTKFERKWREEGQEEFFELKLTKKKHLAVPVKKDTILKSYV